MIYRANSKVLLLEDHELVKDEFNKAYDTEFIATNELGEHLFTAKNKMVIGGSIFSIQKFFNVNSTILVPTLNTDLNVETTVDTLGYPGLSQPNCVSLFGIGTDGAGDTFGSVVDVDYKSKGIAVANLIPFRNPLKTADLTSELQAKYFMKKDTGTRYAYYLKAFEQTPVLKSYFADGTPVTSDVYLSSKTEAIKTYIEINIKISKDDIREYFEVSGGGITNGRVNTIAFYFGYPVSVDAGARNEYREVRCFSKINFKNEPLDDDSKELNGVYRIYIGG